MVGFEGTTPADIPADLVAQAGGVILFKRNIINAEQVYALVEGIRAVPREDKLPPLIAIDQEGGTVSRLAGFGTTTPSAMALGATKDPAATESMYRLIGEELAALGVSVNFAPVADVNNNPDNPVVGIRSFGDDPHAVGLHVRAAIRGLRGAGIAATAKHFPGHGDTTVDSHLDLPSIPHDLTRMHSLELRPFAAAIAERVDLIMTAHVLFPAIEERSKPATLSRAILTDLLRGELNFEGVLCTDCMEMSAIADRLDPGQAACEAVSAGADLVLFSRSVERSRAARDALRSAVLDGRLPEAGVQRSLERNTALRARLASVTSRLGRGVVGTPEHKAAALEVARRAITVVRDPKSVLPLKMNVGEKIFVVQFSGAAQTPVEDDRKRYTTAIGASLADSPARLHEQVRSLDPAGQEYKQLLMAAGSANAIVAITTRAKQHPLQAQAVADLAMLGKRTVVVASREPYDAEVLAPDLAVIASYGDDSNAMKAAAGVILGTHSAAGKLPVSLKTSASPVH
jgi:beta-N-acetylhexosaminidase